MTPTVTIPQPGSAEEQIIGGTMIEAKYSGRWWVVARAYCDGIEIVTATDDLDGQVHLRWLAPHQVREYRFTAR